MKYDDLLNIPYKPHGRSKEEGFDCYGLAVEMCRRAGTPLRDLYGGIVDLPADGVNDYISGGLNVREIPAPKVGALAYSIYKGNVHVAYIVERNLVIHATTDKGVRVTPIEIMKPIAFYEVINESDTIQDTIERENAD